MNDDEQWLFDEHGNSSIKGMVQAQAHDTSVEAAHSIVRQCKTKLHGLVLEAFREYGPMTDDQLQELPQFSAYGPTTVRKRRTELYQAGKIEDSNIKRPNERGHNMKVWRLTTKGQQ